MSSRFVTVSPRAGLDIMIACTTKGDREIVAAYIEDERGRDAFSVLRLSQDDRDQAIALVEKKLADEESDARALAEAQKEPSFDGLVSSMLSQRENARARGVCSLCQSRKMGDGDFKDDLSRRERAITYTCQLCQNRLFDEAGEA